jgi:predicted enzyme related to lactoylglutathione lyase
MAVNGIAFTMYPVSDMPKAVTFYRDVLGLTPGGLASDFWTEFEVGGGTFGVGTFEQVGKAGTAQSLALEVSDMAAFRKKLAEAGVESSEPHETPVCFISRFSDPDGNSLCLHQSKPR